jgi:hypothetical protein
VAVFFFQVCPTGVPRGGRSFDAKDYEMTITAEPWKEIRET